MAVPNMIVTLAMNATKYSRGLKSAARETTSFGQFTTKAFNLAKGALIGLTIATIRYIPTLANMGAESRKADIQLRFMLETMEGVSKATDATVKRMAVYADRVSVATGIDDEQVKAVQRKLLVFKSLRKTADELGGTFDRTTSAAIDLAAAGFGDMESNAVKLGRILQDPVKNLNALNRAGITFTATEQRKIKALAESGKLLEAQDMILKSVEGRVSGLAEASATPFERMVQQFNQIGDAIGEAMLPALEDMNKQVMAWLGSKQGKQDIKDITALFVIMSKVVAGIARVLLTISKWVNGNDAKKLQDSASFWSTVGGKQNPVTYTPGGGTYSTNGPARGAPAPVINFNAPVDSVSAGREVARVLADYQRANGGMR